MTYATTFSGIGGWEIGLNACGWELQWQCESDPWCQRLLKERFGVPVYDDIRTICEHNPPQVDALIGSPPCQPFSVAGAQRGTSDERHLFPAFIELVSQIRPRYVLMEQVPAILTNDGGRAFGGYIAGLAALGFDCLWHCIPACAVGANHKRDRVWIVANDAREGSTHNSQSQERSEQPRRNPTVRGSSDVADTERTSRRPDELGREKERRTASGGCSENVATGGSGRFSYSGTESKHQLSRSVFTQADRQWLTEPNVGRVAHGVPARAHRLKGLGNAVIPQIPYIIGQAINQIEATTAAT